MNAYIVIIALVYETVAVEEPDEYYDIGTVLFSSSDMSKICWSTAEVALLKARKRFLEILPPLQILNTRDCDFTKSILDYFRDSYSVVKREATDVDSGSMLTTALYDTIGAYMKMWVLPKAKLAFYTGAISQDDATRLWQFHDEIKRYLNTDGEGWHKANPNFVSSLPVNIEPSALPFSKKLLEPCDALMYVENTKTGFKIPIPKVSWLNGSESMFVPLKNYDVISLNSPNSSDSLLKYYDTAKNCIESNSVEDKLSYDSRFQDWLLKDVIPHLNDEKLYPPLKSVLSLLNTPRHLYKTNKTLSLKKLTSLIDFIPVDFSTRIGIITAIIYLEILWCVCALCCLGCTRFTKRKAKKKVYLYIDPGKPKALHRTWTESTQCGTAFNEICDRCTETTRANNQLSAEIQCPQRRSQDTTCAHNSYQRSVGTGSHRNVQIQLSPITTKLDDGPKPEQRSSTKLMAAKQSSGNIDSRKISSVGVLLDTEFCTDVKDENKKKNETDSVNHGLHHIDTTPMPNNTEQKEKETDVIHYVDETEMKVKSNLKNGTKRSKKRPLTFLTDDYNTKHRQSVQEISSQTQKDINAHVRGAKRTSMKPYLEIIIDRPKIGSVCTVDMVEIKNIKAVKPSGIPKRFFTNINTQTLVTTNEKVRKRGKSLIPLPKHIANEDTITRSNKGSKDVMSS